MQVEPLLPETPEIPLGYARADDDRQITAINIRAAMQRRFNVFWHDSLLDDWGGGLLSSLLVWLDYFAFRADTKTHTQPQLNLFAEIRPEWKQL